MNISTTNDINATSSLSNNDSLYNNLNLVHDLNLVGNYQLNTHEWWQQFISLEEFNQMKSEDQTHIRLLFEAFEIPLKALRIEGIDEVARNSDGTLWGYGPFFPCRKGMISTRGKLYPWQSNSPEVDKLSDDACIKGLRALSAYWKTFVHEKRAVLECDIPFLGYRFASTIFPLDEAPSFNMRKKASRLITLDEYVELGVLTPSQRVSLREVLANKKNILVAGATNSGKTTFCNGLLHEISVIDPLSRILIIEEVSRELQCAVKDKVSLLIPPVMDEKNENLVNASTLLKASLRRTPTRIVLGEVRDGAAINLLQAWNSGHPGGVCTIHASSARSALSKFEQYLESGGWSVSRKMIADNINCIVSLQLKTEMTTDGKMVPKRVVEEIKFVAPYNSEKGDYDLNDL